MENTIIVRYGRIGSLGISKEKIFSSNSEAYNEYNRLITSKLKKGYVEKTAKETSNLLTSESKAVPEQNKIPQHSAGGSIPICIADSPASKKYLNRNDRRKDYLYKCIDSIMDTTSYQLGCEYGQYPFEVLYPQKPGRIFITDILKSMGIWESATKEQLINAWKGKNSIDITGQIYSVLSICEKYLFEIEYNKLSVYDPMDRQLQDQTYFLFGRLNSEEWFGLIPDCIEKPCIIGIDGEVINKAAYDTTEKGNKLLSEICPLLDKCKPSILIGWGIWPVKRLVHAFGKSKKDILECLLTKVNFLVTVEFHALMMQEEKDSLADDKDGEYMYQDIDTFFSAELTNNRFYYIGYGSVFTLVLMGETPQNDTICVKVNVVWT